MATIRKPFEVEEKDLAKLSSDDFTSLMKRLITAELHKAGLPKSAVEGTLQINISDGGEDIRVEWEGGPDRTDYIPSRCTVFQCKAENLSDTKLRNEPQLDDKSGLKVAVADVVSKSGAYVLATTKTNTTTPKKAGTGKKNKNAKAKKGKKTKKLAAKTKLQYLADLLRGSMLKHDAGAGAVQIAIYGGPKLSDWINKHPMLAIWAKQCIGIASPDFPFRPISEWGTFSDLSNPLVEWSAFDGHISNIRKVLSSPREVLRLQGHSGLGKSRLVFEALNKTDGDVIAENLQPLVAYVRDVTQGLVSHVRNLVNDGVRAIVVVDDCPPDLHKQLSDEVHRQNSQISMITLDLSFDDTPDKQIVLEEAPEERIKDILRTSGFLGSDDDLQRAAKFCSGFPQIAVLVGKASADGATHFADFKDKERIVERLVWGRDEEDEDKIWFLRALSVFAVIGFEGERQGEFDWVATNLLGMSSDEAQQQLTPFKRRRILQSRGYSIFVVPKPLAAHLAAYYWTDGPTGKRQLLKGGSLPGDLQRQLCERLRDLDYLENARAIAAELCGASGPFGTAEALNTEFGAQCLRALAEVAPLEVTDALTRSFAEWSITRIRNELTHGRRQLVWAIEALAWEPAVFEDAMRILLKFAAGENEEWSNNATGEFLQRFRVQLPGTSVSFEQRALVLRHFVDEASPEELPILVDALMSAIDAASHSRVVGSESHGTKKSYQDYHPKTYGEYHRYADSALELLIELVSRVPQLKVQIKRELAGINLGIVIAELPFDRFVWLIELLRPAHEPWPEMLERLAWSLRHELAGDDPNVATVRERVRKLYNTLTPTSLEGRIAFYVKSVPWNFEGPEDPDDDDFSLNRRRAQAIAVEAAQDWNVFVQTVDSLSIGETREVFAYGRSFFDATSRKSDAMQIALNALEEAGNKGNPSLVGGLLAGLFEYDNDGAHRILNYVAQKDDLRRHLAYFTAIKLTEAGLQLAIEAIAAGRIPVDDARIYGMGRVLDEVPAGLVRKLVDVTQSRGTEGAAVALHLLMMYTHGNKENFHLVADQIYSVLRSGVAFSKKRLSSRIDHDYETLTKKILERDPRARQLGMYLARHLVAVAKSGRISRDRLYRNLTKEIFDKFPTDTLKVFAGAVEKASARERWMLSTLLGSPLGFDGKHDGPLFTLDAETIVSVSKKYPKTFAPMVAEIAPLFATINEGKRVWSELGQRLLGEFGNLKDVLSAISRNLFTGGYMGPASRHYQSYIFPLEQLRNHKLLSVRTWAKKELATLKRQVAREVKREEEAAVRG